MQENEKATVKNTITFLGEKTEILPRKKFNFEFIRFLLYIQSFMGFNR
ncbi:hypothetical protein LEP1GSC036_4623 [Leptospira weilii str. 2006001853]|uniref:Uncharacterized protein n=4 Tax=Leptospira weilii TaxID=28184 RepID=A0A828Z0K5_9LEPT|nr:hypothetical protein LEP1GSC036_4623 [Leptospira weilii str. 2006001853]EMJ61333.1 hypothetical protein LEP1GSC051_2421 [Leptospira sp. P2653]EMM71938.1 hypothetical protein LEP1GSC038_4176 [Leptospira weilii str. 2006001855]EMN44260.1 hypothetical protein LEP1GSC086_2906 [Leptospira weilii str. LNT 1234]EMN88766.1 hypothetical protein LEP1GSC108_1313 [Leptospira weilii str. UI 13098]EMY16564.1 hypothetical protein LEP1GSC043_0797 [Leptospira weilii str. Ecochallenge]